MLQIPLLSVADAENQKFQLKGPPVSIVQHNVYEQEVIFGHPTQREIDGQWESSWERYYDTSNFYEVTEASR